jgi:MFS family permease
MPGPDTPRPPDAEDAKDFIVNRSRKLRLLIPLIVAFAFLMEQLDSTIVTTAIPDMAASLHVAPLQMNLAITSYILSLAVFIPVSGWIADRFGARRVFAAALLIFTIASALCGLAQSLPVLIVMRVVQGFGGAMMTPVGRLILLRSFPRSELVTAMTYMSIPAIMGPTIGPLLGGALTTYANWRWIFYVNVPIGLIGILLALRFVQDVRLDHPPRFDVIGFLLCGAGLSLLQFALENLGHPIVPRAFVFVFGAVALVLLVAYWAYAARHADPALDLSLFSIRTFRVSTMAGGLSRIGVNAVPFMLPLLFQIGVRSFRVSVITGGLCRVGLNAVPFLLPLMLQIGFGLSPVQSGSLTFVLSLGAMAVRPISLRLLRQVGFRGLLTGNGVFCSGVIALFALTTGQTPHWLIFLHVMAFGVARSVQFMTTNALTYADTPAHKLSNSTSLGGVIQQLTVSFGVSIAATLLAVIAGPGHLPSVADFHHAFLLVALITLVSAPGFLLLTKADGAHVSRYKVKPKKG